MLEQFSWDLGGVIDERRIIILRWNVQILDRGIERIKNWIDHSALILHLIFIFSCYPLTLQWGRSLNWAQKWERRWHKQSCKLSNHPLMSTHSLPPSEMFSFGQRTCWNTSLSGVSYFYSRLVEKKKKTELASKCLHLKLACF